MVRWHTHTREGAGRLRGMGVSARAAVLGLMAVCLSGCTHWDSFFNPSIVGRWEQTPTEVPVLERIAAIEDGEGDLIDYTEVSSADLAPQVDEYVIGPGDQLQLTIWDLEVPGQPSVLPRVVDPNGYVEVPQIGRVFIAGQSEAGANETVSEALAPILQSPLVSVLLTQRRASRYHLQGNVQAPGAYPIPSADFRLLEALIIAGGVNEASSDYVYVIRQVALDDRLDPNQGEGTGGRVGSGGQTPDGSVAGEDLIDVIDDLTGGSGSSRDNMPDVGGSPMDDMDTMEEEAPEPAVDLIDDPTDEPNAGGATGRTNAGAGRWVFLNGEWTQTPGRMAPAGDDDGSSTGDPVVTQRVVRVPVKPLMTGDARYNIVVRAGDVIRVPPPDVGNVYVAGQIARPGVYQLPLVGRGLTLQRLIAAAGGLSVIGIPERVDLTRMVGPDRQATIMLNLRAIAEGTQPDVFIKPDDMINVGTNFWALPLAVIRGGFRASYGFGFLLDRNFGNDVFGAPPVNRNGFGGQ